MKKIGSFVPAMVVALLLVFCFSTVCLSTDEKAPVPQVPVEGKVTMVDIGAKKCIPCKMMLPILKELEEEYTSTGKAAIVFIDVWENPAVGHKFGIKSIPTQIFYDAEGKEVSRHEGFLDKNSIITRLETMGVK
ncbi:MAG: thioredoxin family protein [Desulfobacteraceae bacterium]|nr:thioredoxin family protein [Desulfobacteraceae bacterium]